MRSFRLYAAPPALFRPHAIFRLRCPVCRVSSGSETSPGHEGHGTATDRRDVDRLVVEHLPAALRFALRLTRDEHAAEDVVQEALCRVLRQWRTYRGEASFKTWFLQIVVNVDRDRRRRFRVSRTGGRTSRWRARRRCRRNWRRPPS